MRVLVFLFTLFHGRQVAIIAIVTAEHVMRKPVIYTVLRCLGIGTIIKCIVCIFIGEQIVVRVVRAFVTL